MASAHASLRKQFARALESGASEDDAALSHAVNEALLSSNGWEGGGDGGGSDDDAMGW